MNGDTASSTTTLSGELIEPLPEPIRAYIRYLENIDHQHQVRIQELETQVRELEARLSKNNRLKSSRKRSDKKRGDQQGHIGKGLSHEAITQILSNYIRCASNLSNKVGIRVEARRNARHIERFKEMLREMIIKKGADKIPEYYHPDFVFYENGKAMGYKTFLESHLEYYARPVSYEITYDSEHFLEEGDKVAGRIWLTRNRFDEPPAKIEIIFISQFKEGKIYRLWELTYLSPPEIYSAWGPIEKSPCT